MPKISIIVPVCNVEKYLAKCIDSILNQSFSDIEVLCMDDGSTDASGEILDDFARQDERIRVIHKENTGYGNTMNQAVLLSTGDYIGIVESDDYIAKDMYQVLYEVAINNELDFVKSDYYQLWNNEDGSDYTEYRSLSEDESLYNRVICPNKDKRVYHMEKFTWNALYKKEFLMENGIRYNETPGASYQDNGFWFQTFYFAKRVMFMKQAFYYYKQDNPNSSINNRTKIFCMKKEYDFIDKFLEKRGEIDRELYAISFCYRIRGCFYTLSMLTDELKLQLAYAIKEDYLYYDSLDKIDLKLFSQEEIVQLQEILHSPQEYVDKKIEQSDCIREKLQGYMHIVIYGAGSYGKAVFYHICKNVSSNVTIDFAVSDVKNCTNWRGKTVHCINEFESEREDLLIIIAVKELSDAYQDMLQNVHNKGFKNICTSEEILI